MEELEWSAVYDDEGSIYYHNSRTDETSWEIPDKFNPPEEPNVKAEGDGNNTEGGGTWEKHVDESSGDVYYYNPTTEVTTWDKPEGYVEVEDDDTKEATEGDKAEEDKADNDDVKDTTITKQEEEEEALPSSPIGGPEDDGVGEEQEEEEEAVLPNSPIGRSHNDDDDDDERLPASPIGGDSDDDNGDNSPTKGSSSGAWEKHETDDGQVYYYNPDTEETTWDTPAGYDGDATTKGDDDDDDDDDKDADEKKAAVKKEEPVAQASDSNNKGSWEQLKDEEGNVYYYNSQTEVTQWDKPEDFDESATTAAVVADAASPKPEAAAKESDAKAPAKTSGWEKLQDDDGNVYYYNSQTEVTQWEAPDGFDESAVVAVSDKEDAAEEFSSSPKPAAETNDKAAAGGGGKWEKYTDEEGRTYYYNATSGETQWEAPEGFVDDGNDDDDDEKKADEGDEFQPSPTRSPSPMATDEEDDEKERVKEEPEPEPEPEIDPAVKRVMDAEEALNKPDSVLEPGMYSSH